MNPDSLTPGFVLLALVVIVGIWLALGVRDRRRWRRAVQRRAAWYQSGRCALLWFEGYEYHVCTRPHEHTGPHVDENHRAVFR